MIQPDYPTAMGLLAHLNSDELKEMLNDDTKFDTVLKDVKQVLELFCYEKVHENSTINYTFLFKIILKWFIKFIDAALNVLCFYLKDESLQSL